MLGVADKVSYERWNNFRQWVLDPAIAAINDFGTVSVKMTPEKVGRAVASVRFDWDWKTIDEARVTDEENEKPAVARRKEEEIREAPSQTSEMNNPSKKNAHQASASCARQALGSKAVGPSSYPIRRAQKPFLGR